MIYESFCGGIFETNCYLIHPPAGAVLFDAPDGSCAWLQNRGVDLKQLILTHGHIDHVGDVSQSFVEARPVIHGRQVQAPALDALCVP